VRWVRKRLFINLNVQGHCFLTGNALSLFSNNSYKKATMNVIENYKPFSFQEKSIEKGIGMLEKYNGLFVMDETGLGKTITVATILKNLNLEDKSLLIIAPNIHKPAWANIMGQAGIKAVISGNRKFPGESFDYIVVDEAHNIGTQKGKTYKELFVKIHSNNTKVILISATPYNNNISAFLDLCALIPFPFDTAPYVMLHYWGMAAMYWEKEYQKSLRFGGMGLREIGNRVSLEYDYQNAIKNISTFLFLFAIRNTRSDIIENYKDDIAMMGHFPVVVKGRVEYSTSSEREHKIFKTINIINASPFAWQNKNAYFLNKEDQVESLNGIYRSFLCKRLESSFSAFYKSLEKAYNNIKDISPEDKIIIGDNEYALTPEFIKDIERDKATYKRLFELWEGESDDEKINSVFNNVGDKTVIFTEYVDTLNLLVKKAEELKIPFLAFHSQTDEKEFERIEREFDANLCTSQQRNEIRVLLCTDVLSEGVNLHRADNVIHFDSKWNPSKIIQREGRVNRILNKSKVGRHISALSVDVPHPLDGILALNEKTYRKERDAELLLSSPENHMPVNVRTMLKTGYSYNSTVLNKFYHVFFSSDLGDIVFEKDTWDMLTLATWPEVLAQVGETSFEAETLTPSARRLFRTVGYKGGFVQHNYIHAFSRGIDSKYRTTYEALMYNVMYSRVLIEHMRKLYGGKPEANPAFAFINKIVENKFRHNGAIPYAEITAYIK